MLAQLLNGRSPTILGAVEPTSIATADRTFPVLEIYQQHSVIQDHDQINLSQPLPRNGEVEIAKSQPVVGKRTQLFEPINLPLVDSTTAIYDIHELLLQLLRAQNPMAPQPSYQLQTVAKR
ncbi:hypothetical protein D3C71_1243310 [compost metagenome]